MMEFLGRSPVLSTVLLLVGSNIFMTFAWYGHLKGQRSGLLLTILSSWGIAFFEYCLMVPANRIGSSALSISQLKIIQELISLTVFAGVATLFLGEHLRWNHLAAFVCILGAVAFLVLPGRA